MSADPPSSPKMQAYFERRLKNSKYKSDILSNYILASKKAHDGISPTLRQMIEFYGQQEGHWASTSTMRNVLRRICRENNWTYTYRGTETLGEWHRENSSQSS